MLSYKCQVPCCQDCLLGKHNKHFFIEIEEAANKARGSLPALLASLEDSKLPEIEKAHRVVKHRIDKYNDSIRKTKEEAKRRFQDLREKINTEERTWIKQVNKREKGDLKEIRERLTDIENQIANTKQLIEKCKLNMKTASDFLLLSYHSECKKAASCKAMTHDLPPLVNLSAPQCQLSTADIVIGSISKRKTKVTEQKGKGKASFYVSKIQNMYNVCL